MAERLVYETHLHTPLCKHAEGWPEDYAEVAERRGLKGIIVTCHCPLPDGISQSVRMRPELFPRYLWVVEEARERMEGRAEVRLGLESDYLPGLEGWLEALHGKADFEYILGSVHPQIPEYKAAFFRGDWGEFHRTYFRHLAEAAETGLYDCLAHPDLAKNLGPEHYDLEALWPEVLRALDRIAAVGVAMELNTSGLNKTVPEMNPGPRILAAMRERGIPVVVGADAHHPLRVADNYPAAYALLEEAGYAEVSYFLGRERRTAGIAEARASLNVAAFAGLADPAC